MPFLEELGDKIKASGYVPDTNSNHDNVEDDVQSSFSIATVRSLPLLLVTVLQYMFERLGREKQKASQFQDHLNQS